jgi:NAD(P)-dependent dehydrogenase (short-subunit alcohol dehydrogenase family)
MGCRPSTTKWSEADIPTQRGRVFIVTGANSGIGFEVCTALARHGATVIMTARSRERGARALAKVQQAVENADVHLEMLDLASFASVRAFAERVNRAEPPFNKGVDTVILNAGVMNIRTATQSEDGFEMQWQTNHLAHFMLVGLILPTLRKSTKQPVVVPVSSFFAHGGTLTHDTDFCEAFRSGAASYAPEPVYKNTKQANLLYATELHKRHGSWLRVMPCHPGASATNLFRHGWYWIAKPLFQSPAEGALLELRAATDSALPPFTYTGTGGGWKGSPRPEVPAPHSVDPAAAAALWTASEQATGIHY